MFEDAGTYHSAKMLATEILLMHGSIFRLWDLSVTLIHILVYYVA